MKFAAAVSTENDIERAADELYRQTRAQLGDAKADLVLLFVSPHFLPQLTDLIESIHVQLAAKHLIGCTGGSIIGVDQELEGRAAISIWAASLPGITIKPFRITQQQLDESLGPAFWHSELDIAPDEAPSLILLADPFSIESTRLVSEVSQAYPGQPMIGGLASGAQQPGENRLWIKEQVFDSEAVGVALIGPISLRTIVSQGCRPIGEPLIITKAQRNVILELASQPPVMVLQEVLNSLTDPDRRLAKESLFVGRVINEYQSDFHRGDFLIRNIIGLDTSSGAIAIGDREIHSGQTIQFQLRDRDSAEEDFLELLEKLQPDLKSNPPQGALLFTCVGRGKSMFGTPHHDVNLVRKTIGQQPLAGFFCNGEIGPVGDRVFIHGYTVVVGLFGPAK